MLRHPLFLVFFLGFAALLPAQAEKAKLRPDVTVKGDAVTLGDLFEHAGDFAQRAVFRAPDPGVEGMLAARDALEAARQAGLDAAASDLRMIRVTRPAIALDTESFARLIAESAGARLGRPVEAMHVRFDETPPPVLADAAAVPPAVVSRFIFKPRENRFSADILIDMGETQRALTVTGEAFETLSLPVLNEPLPRGGIVSAANVILMPIERRRVDPAMILEREALIGMAARRPLRAGVPVMRTDVEAPRAVRRGENVMILYEAPGLSLSVRGRALGDGAEGEIISILNERSRRTVEGLVIAPGKVRVPATPARVATLIPSPVTE